MRQIVAIFIDAYHQLSEKKIFWLSMAISVLIAGAFSAVSIDEKGFSIFAWDFPSNVMNSQFISPLVFYKTILFYYVGVNFWLTSFAMVMAIISTGSLFPEILSSPSTALLISKPLSRLKIFIIKYFAGLLFVCLQVTAFSLICFLTFGVKTGSWDIRIFYIIPLVVMFFSYLFCVSVFLAHLKMPSLVCVALTLVFWSLTSAVHTVDETLNSENFVVLKQNDVNSEESNNVWLGRLRNILPKTEETIDLIKGIVNPDDKFFKIEEFLEGVSFQVNNQPISANPPNENVSPSKVWILGTSLIFEGVMLAMAAFLFCRRDF